MEEEKSSLTKNINDAAKKKHQDVLGFYSSQIFLPFAFVSGIISRAVFLPSPFLLLLCIQHFLLTRKKATSREKLSKVHHFCRFS